MGDPETVISFRFPLDLKRRFQAACASRGINRSEAIRDAAERYLAMMDGIELPVGRKPPTVSPKARAHR
jgi:metal-responsive CopG/Arc/MetJ family transcriptional regulator